MTVAVTLSVSACGSHGRCDSVAAAMALRDPPTSPRLPGETYELSYEPTEQRPAFPLIIRGCRGERVVTAVLDTGNPGEVTIDRRLAGLGRLVGPVEMAQGAAGTYRRRGVEFELITGLGARWTSPLVNANLDRSDRSAYLGLGFLTGARGFILDHASRRLIVLAGSGDGLESAARGADWAWTHWQTGMTVARAREVGPRPLTVEREWTFEANRPFVIVWVNGEPVPCIVDTGAEVGLVLPDSTLLSGPTRAARLRGHGGAVSGRIGRLDGVEIAGRQFDEVKVFVRDEAHRGASDASRLGVIGMGLLARQAVWFDFEGQRLGLGSLPTS